ncbi:Selenoprotein S [Halotydeus destructor]|nr:Selenoprotein S [Halotydeus destructor]
MMEENGNIFVSVLANYGWHFVFASAIFYFIYLKVKAKLKQSGPSVNSAAKCDQDEKRKEELRLVRLKMQQKLEETAAVELQRQREAEKQKEEQIRKQKIDEWERHQRGEGYFSKLRNTCETNPDDLAKPAKLISRGARFRDNDYNPLTGEGSSSGYRPASRRPAAGGK